MQYSTRMHKKKNMTKISITWPESKISYNYKNKYFVKSYYH